MRNLGATERECGNFSVRRGGGREGGKGDEQEGNLMNAFFLYKTNPTLTFDGSNSMLFSLFHAKVPQNSF